MPSRQELVSQMQIEVTPLVESDIDQFDSILRQHVWDRYTRQILEEEIASIKGYMGGKTDEYGRRRQYLVAKTSSGKVVGCMAFSSPDPDMVAHFFDTDPEESVELLSAFVDRQVYRGGGVGHQLFESICNTAKSEGKKYLLVHSGPRYKASWGFYDHLCDENRGFIVEKYGKGGDANTWLKRL